MDLKALERELKSAQAMDAIEKETVEALGASDAQRIQQVLETIATSVAISKATSARLLKGALDVLEKHNAEGLLMLGLYNALIDWAEKNRRNLLKLDFQMRKAEVLLGLKRYSECLSLIGTTAKVLKNADDKIGLVKLYYLESKVYYELKNMQRAKSALTLARSTSTLVYCPPFLQAKMDLLNGIYLADEREYKTAFAYIIDALEGFKLGGADLSMPAVCARYLLLLKILENKPEEAKSLLAHKLVRPFAGDEFVRMLGLVSDRVADRDLRGCNDAIRSHIEDISKDSFLFNHLKHLSDTLIDANILKIIEPYSDVSVEYIGGVLGFDVPEVENRLRRMILDGRIKGTIDQETMCLKIFHESPLKATVHNDIKDILDVLSEATTCIATK